MKPLRILFLALHRPGRSPSQRFRVEQFQAPLIAAGHAVEHFWLLDADADRRFYRAGHFADKALLAARAARALWQRTSAPALHAYDLVFVQREAFFLGGPWAERRSARHTRLLFDFDDAIWIRDVSAGNRALGFLKSTQKPAELMALADRVFAGNAYLADYARRYNGRVEVVPTVIDTDLFTPPARARAARQPVCIGWIGSPSTVRYLQALLPVLERLHQRYRDRIRFRVLGDPLLHAPHLGLYGEAWSADQELPALRSFDIGVMPLADDDWSRGKCGFKALQYMATGAAAVVSPVGVNKDIVAHGESGLLAASEGDWYTQLSTLIEDADLRRRLAATARESVVARYSLTAWSGPFVRLLEET